MTQRLRKALLVFDKVSIEMEITFQNGSLDHVTPWLKSLGKFFVYFSIWKKLLPVVLRIQSVWAPSAS